MKERDSRQTIVDVVRMMIGETGDVGKITIRQIAERAGVSIGLINYHFKSKDNLLGIAIGDVMRTAIGNFTKTEAYSELSSLEKLRVLLKELYGLAGSNEALIRFILTREITEGNMQTPLSLVPLLKEIFGHRKNDMELRIIALQIIYPIQVTGLNAEAFYMYSGVDLLEVEQRNLFIDVLIDNLIT